MANPNQPNPPNAWQLQGPTPSGPAASVNSANPPTLLAVDSTGFVYYTGANGLVAHAGGGQANGTPITTNVARFITVATAADSALLPATNVSGSVITANLANGLALEIVVTNAAAANSMNIFPATGDQINALGANAAFALAAGKTATFICTVAGQWHAILSA